MPFNLGGGDSEFEDFSCLGVYGKQLEIAIIDDDLTPFTKPVDDDDLSNIYGSVERDVGMAPPASLLPKSDI